MTSDELDNFCALEVMGWSRCEKHPIETCYLGKDGRYITHFFDPTHNDKNLMSLLKVFYKKGGVLTIEFGNGGVFHGRREIGWTVTNKDTDGVPQLKLENGNSDWDCEIYEYGQSWGAFRIALCEAVLNMTRRMKALGIIKE